MKDSLTELSAVHNTSTVEEANLATAWHHIDLHLSEPVRKGQNTGIKMGDHETLKSKGKPIQAKSKC